MLLLPQLGRCGHHSFLSWKAKSCTAQVGGRRDACSSMQHGAAGAPRHVLPHLDCAVHIAPLPLGMQSSITSPAL